MSDLPIGWKEVLVRDVADLRSGVGFPLSLQGRSEGDLGFFKVGDISQNWHKRRSYLSTAEHYITLSDAEQLRATPLPAGSVVFAKIGAAVALNRRAILKHAALVDNNVMGLVPHACTTPEFLFHFMCRVDLGAKTRGGNVPSLRKSDVEEIVFPLPPLPEQKRIVAKIEELFSELEAGEESLRKARRQLGVYRQSLLKQAFEGHLTAPWRTQNPDKLESPESLLARIQSARQARYEQQINDWNSAGRVGKKPSAPKAIDPLTEDERVFLLDLPSSWMALAAEAIGDVQLGRQRSPKNLSKDYPTKYIRAANITESGLVLDDILEMEFSPQERKTFTLQPGDIVLSEASGSASQVGKPAMWRGEIPDCCFQNTVIRHRLFDREQSVFYLWLFRYFYLHGIFAQTAGGVGINHLSAGKFSRLPVPICSLSEQQEIVRILDEQFEVIERNEREIDAALRKSEALRQAILHRAFTGRLVPQDPADPPASPLLARLRAEHEGSSAKAARKPRRTRQPSSTSET